MESIAIARYIGMSPTKLRLVASQVKGLELPDAVDMLKTMPKLGASYILKVILSAAANGKVKDPDLKEEKLYLKKVVIDEAATFKRFMPRARGRASRIKKRNSHITVVLSTE